MFKVISKNFPRFTSDPEIISDRLKAPLTRPELYGLAISLAVTIGITAMSYSMDGIPFDFNIYIKTLDGVFTGYYYPYWVIAFFLPFKLLPPLMSFFMWGLLNIIGIWYACRVFGGNSFFTLVSFQMLYALGHGQIIGIMILGLAFFWVMFIKGKWDLAGIGLLLASAKVQSGFIIALLLWLMAELPFKYKLRSLLIPLIVTVLSLIIYPNWLIEIIAETQPSSIIEGGNISLWRWIGPWSLILFLPLFFIPLSKTELLIVLFSAIILTEPYFNMPDLLTIFIFPIHWIFIFIGNIGYAWNGENWLWIQSLGIIPLGVYLSIIIPRILEVRKNNDFLIPDSNW
ncbi:MAG: DUF2029 domain-containing protein [Chloroflexota bacterium]